jgi:PIN domain nuclease of toxin-antitoxin system
MADLVTDTHALIWYLESSPRLGPLAGNAFDDCDKGEITIHVPTICLVKLVYLQEKGRIPAQLKAQFDALLQSGTTGLAVVSLTEEVVNALPSVSRMAVPDMPDRIIAATALHLGLGLISRDRKIQLSGLVTIW